MKKIVFMLFAFMCLGICSGYAQDEAASADEIATLVDASKTRMAKIEKLLKNRPKSCGLPSIDGFTDQVYVAAEACQVTAVKFENLYTRQVSEPDADGVTNVQVTKPKLEDWMELLALIVNQGVEITNLAPAAAGMTGALTEISNPLQIGKAKKSIQATGDLFKLIGEENVAEVKAIKGIISILKSKGNL